MNWGFVSIDGADGLVGVDSCHAPKTSPRILRRVLPREQSGQLLGADRAAVLQARAELWEEQLRALAAAFAIRLDRLPRKKSAIEKLTLAAALKRTTSVAKSWLAQRLQMGAVDSLGPLLHRFRASGAMAREPFRSILYRFLT